VHSNNMSEMGGLRARMPTTFWTMLIGSLALAGVIPLAGFWSKDELLVVANEAGKGWLFWVLLATALLTAYYTTRMVVRTFLGSYRGQAHPHESPPSMTGPLVFLAACTVAVGWVGAPLVVHAPFGKWVFFEHPHEAEFVFWIAAASSLVALGGIAIGWLAYREADTVADPMEPRLGGVWTLLVHRFYIDDFYMAAIVLPVRDTLSSAVYWTNQNIIDGVVNGAAVLTRALARLIAWIDRNVVDGAVNLVGSITGESGGLLKYLQSGNVQWYAVVLFVGVIAITIVFVKVA
jgi:NADH-quinone oxidoreductase subunit L